MVEDAGEEDPVTIVVGVSGVKDCCQRNILRLICTPRRWRKGYRSRDGDVAVYILTRQPGKSTETWVAIEVPMKSC